MNLKLLSGLTIAAALSLPLGRTRRRRRRSRLLRRAPSPGPSCVARWEPLSVLASVAIAGGIADDKRPRFRSYVTERRVPSYRYDREVRVGADLPLERWCVWT